MACCIFNQIFQCQVNFHLKKNYWVDVSYQAWKFTRSYWYTCTFRVILFTCYLLLISIVPFIVILLTYKIFVWLCKLYSWNLQNIVRYDVLLCNELSYEWLVHVHVSHDGLGFDSFVIYCCCHIHILFIHCWRL